MAVNAASGTGYAAPQNFEANPHATDAQNAPPPDTAADTGAAALPHDTPSIPNQSLPSNSVLHANIARQLGLSPGRPPLGAAGGQAPQNNAQPKNVDQRQDTPTLAHASTGVVKGVRQFGPERQIVLGHDDQAALDRYEGALAKQKAAIQACQGKNQQATDAAKQAITQLNSDIAKDKKNLKDDRGDKQKLAADQKQLAADQKNLAAAKRDLSQATHANATCPKLKTGISSVPPSAPPTLISGDQEQALNQAYGTNINFRKVLNDAEGGSYADGYVPWWPDVRTNAKGDHVVSVDKNGTVVGYIGANGGPNGSGVTVGPGVDLGAQKNKETYFTRLGATNIKTKSLTTDQLQALKDKLSPYMGLQRAEASQYLIAHPLHLNDKELELLTSNAVDTHLQPAKDAYKRINPKGDFTKLSENQQTILFSEAYQRGAASSVFRATAAAYGSGNSSYDPPGREHGWINR